MYLPQLQPRGLEERGEAAHSQAEEHDAAPGHGQHLMRYMYVYRCVCVSETNYIYALVDVCL